MSLAATANSMPTETVSPTDYDCRSLPLTKRLSTKKKRDKNFSSPAKKCGSVEEISFTGTQVSEIPDNFSILLDPITLTGMVDMDLLKQNGMSDHIRRKVEGKVDPNTIKNKRLSIRRPKDDECTDFSDKNGSELEDSALGTSLIVHTSKIEVNVEGDSNRDPPLTPSVDTLKEMQLLHHNGIRTSTASTDSGIDHVTQGMSTENFPTESGPARDANVTLTPSFKTLSPRPSPFDSPKYRMNSHRESMLLSQLCIVTVTVPAEVHQGHKGKGASLKFRFSPYTQIESLRLAILKVLCHVTCTSFFDNCCMPVHSLYTQWLCVCVCVCVHVHCTHVHVHCTCTCSYVHCTCSSCVHAVPTCSLVHVTVYYR